MRVKKKVHKHTDNFNSVQLLKNNENAQTHTQRGFKLFSIILSEEIVLPF